MRALLVAVGTILAGLTLAPTARAAAPPPPPERWAFVVGINNYAGSTHDTVGGTGDAIDVRDALRRAGFADDHMLVLTDGQATAQAIREGLGWLGDHSTDTSLSVFHYSGHVKQIGGDLDHDGEALDEYLWGTDNRYIADGEVAGWLKRVRGRLWADIAGCEAAGFDDGVSAPNRIFTSSSQESEKSFENPSWHNSIFSGLLVDAGMLQGKADADGDKRVSIQEAFMYAAREAPRLTANQQPGPQHPVMNGGDGKAWFLDVPKPAPAKKPKKKSCFLVCLP
jgi:hypothetical protein